MATENFHPSAPMHPIVENPASKIGGALSPPKSTANVAQPSDLQMQYQILNGVEGITYAGRANYYAGLKRSHHDDEHKRKNFFRAFGHAVKGFFIDEESDGTEARAEPQAASDLASAPHAPDRASMKVTAATTVAEASSGREDWQNILYAHARHDQHGNAVDGKGNIVDLHNMNAVFGQRLAQTCLDLDSQGYAGHYEIISGVRSHDEQAALYRHYKGIGSNHPVALPGQSLHEIGCAADISCTTGNASAFYRTYAQTAQANNLSGVHNDPQHCQMSRDEVHDFIMAQSKGSNANTVSNLPGAGLSFDHPSPAA